MRSPPADAVVPPQVKRLRTEDTEDSAERRYVQVFLVKKVCAGSLGEKGMCRYSWSKIEADTCKHMQAFDLPFTFRG